jgi:hypothetical protein
VWRDDDTPRAQHVVAQKSCCQLIDLIAARAACWPGSAAIKSLAAEASCKKRRASSGHEIMMGS